jgi:hypothetical protein
MNVSECAHCGRPGPMHASLMRGGRNHPLCHPNDGLDCLRLVTIYGEPIGARKPGCELDGEPYARGGPLPVGSELPAPVRNCAYTSARPGPGFLARMNAAYPSLNLDRTIEISTRDGDH